MQTQLHTETFLTQRDICGYHRWNFSHSETVLHSYQPAPKNIKKIGQYSAEIANPKQVRNQTTQTRSIQLFSLPSMHKFYSEYFHYKSFQCYVIHPTSNTILHHFLWVFEKKHKYTFRPKVHIGKPFQKQMSMTASKRRFSNKPSPLSPANPPKDDIKNSQEDIQATSSTSDPLLRG